MAEELLVSEFGLCFMMLSVSEYNESDSFL
jgi:hypothetical protein